MRTAFIIAATLSLAALTAHAENWVRPTDVADGSKRAFELKKSCEELGERCYQIDGWDFDALETAPIEVDDITKPVFEAKSNVVLCDTREECDTHREAKDFCPGTHFSVTAKVDPGKGWQAYCTRMIGYEKKMALKVQESASKKAENIAKADARKAKADAIAEKKKSLKDTDVDAANTAKLKEVVKQLRDLLTD